MVWVAWKSCLEAAIGRDMERQPEEKIDAQDRPRKLKGKFTSAGIMAGIATRD